MNTGVQLSHLLAKHSMEVYLRPHPDPQPLAKSTHTGLRPANALMLYLYVLHLLLSLSYCPLIGYQFPMMPELSSAQETEPLSGGESANSQ